ncbi:MAG: YhdP family protein, partial [Sulfurifustaceae bacterium]
MRLSPTLRLPPLRRVGRFFSITALVLLILLGALYAAARLYWPTVVTRDIDLAGELTRRAGRPVQFGAAEPYWDGIHPGVRIVDATVYGDDGRTPAVRMAEVRASISLWSLLRGRIELRGLGLVHPVFTLARDTDGRIGVAGFAPTDTPAAGGAAWLLAQPRLTVEEGELRWIDAREPDRPLALSQLDLQLRNSGERHDLTVSAAFPPAICRQCSVAFEIAGNPFDSTWNGKARLRAEALDAAALPLVLRERLPQPLRGRFDAQLTADWRDGGPVRVRGQASVAALHVLFDAQRPALDVRELSGDLDWRRTADGWRLELSDLKLGLTRPAWYAGRLRAMRTDGQIRFEAQRVELDDLTAFAAPYRGEHPLLERWTAVRPSGVLQNLEARLPDSPASSGVFRASAELVGVSVAANESLPGLRGLSGHLEFDENGGQLDLDGKNFALDLRTVFRAPLEARRVAGRLSWERTENAWRVIGSDLRVAGDDGNGSGRLRLDIPFDSALSPVLELRVDFSDGVGAHAARYYPARHLPPRTLEWMEYAFMSGHVVSGHLIYEGPVHEWPFENGQGRFEIQGHVRDASYRYLRGWTPLTHAEADVSINGANVRVTGRGRIGALTARDIRVEVSRADDGLRTVGVHARVEGPVAETLRVLRAVESQDAAAWQPHLARVTRADGSGVLDLDLRLPLKRELGPVYQVAYRFGNAALHLGDAGGLDAANGVVRFTEAGLRDSTVQGQLFGGPLIVSSAYDANGLRVQGEGQFVLAELLRARRPLAERVSGNVAWSFGWHNAASGPQLRAEANLGSVRSRLPAPFTKADAASPAKLTLVTEMSRPETVVLALAGSGAVSGKFALAREGTAWHFKKGRVEFGKSGAALPLRDGFEIGVTYDALDLDRWLPLLGDGGGDAATPEIVTALSTDIKRL